jgi:hypothetical protein
MQVVRSTNDALTQFAAYKCAFLWTHDVCEAMLNSVAMRRMMTAESQQSALPASQRFNSLPSWRLSQRPIMLQNPVRIEKGRSSGMVPSSCHHTVAQTVSTSGGHTGMCDGKQ